MAAIKVNAPITENGAAGYLLWLRRDMPRVYVQAVKQIPAVANFERFMRAASTPKNLGCCGLGDDVTGGINFSDMSFDPVAASANFSSAASAFDTSALSSFWDPITVSGQYMDSSGAISSGMVSPAISDASIVDPSVPQLPPVASNTGGFWNAVGSAASAGLSAAGSVAKSIGTGVVQSLPAVAALVKAAAPIAVAAIQTSAALKGATPAQTGYFINPATGQPYLSAVQTPYNTLSVAGNIPLWAIAAAGVGVLLLVMNRD